MTKYCVVPGYVKSFNDDDRHYVGVSELVRLYELREGEWQAHDQRRAPCLGMPHLYPSYTGNYRRPT